MENTILKKGIKTMNNNYRDAQLTGDEIIECLSELYRGKVNDEIEAI